jgi:serine/threonine protein kinase
MSGQGSGAAESNFFARGAHVGDVVGSRYRVVRLIGSGGMGQVVEVQHLELDKRFALKLVRPDRWDQEIEERFRREARALAKVDSPRVAQITDFGVDPERGPFYVMELVDGESLDQLLRREGALGFDRALEIAIGIAEALVDVHAAGIVHRDVKPGNIGLCSRGAAFVRLLDFGLAASIDDRFGSRMTESKRVIGSMPYMAPEQFHGERANAQMDIWALGVVLFEMCTGKLPFDAPSTAALIHQILSAPAPRVPSMPGRAGALIDAFLAKDPHARVATAREALARLESAVTAPSDPAPSAATGEATRVDLSGQPTAAAASSSASIARVPRRRRSLVVASALGLVALAALAAIFAASMRPGTASVEPERNGSPETASSGVPSTARAATVPSAPLPALVEPGATEPSASGSARGSAGAGGSAGASADDEGAAEGGAGEAIDVAPGAVSSDVEGPGARSRRIAPAARRRAREAVAPSVATGAGAAEVGATEVHRAPIAEEWSGEVIERTR